MNLGIPAATGPSSRESRVAIECLALTAGDAMDSAETRIARVAVAGATTKNLLEDSLAAVGVHDSPVNSPPPCSETPLTRTMGFLGPSLRN